MAAIFFYHDQGGKLECGTASRIDVANENLSHISWSNNIFEGLKLMKDNN